MKDIANIINERMMKIMAHYETSDHPYLGVLTEINMLVLTCNGNQVILSDIIREYE